MDQDQLIEETAHHVKVAASQVARRYRGFVTYADMAQEGVVWVLRHPATVEKRLEDGRRGEGRLVGALARYMDKQARKERAASIGYKVEDEAYYNRSIIEAALPAIWDNEMLVRPPAEEAPEGPRKPANPAETSNWLVTVLDVRSAWEKAEMDTNWRLALAYRYGEGLRLYQIADLLEVSDTTASSYIEKGLRSLTNQLGGKPPYECEGECECGKGRAGRRHIISNAEARAIQENQYDE